jgi:mRNA interferase MazF
MRNPLRGDVWFIDLSPAKGREQAGIRPGLIISSNGFNNSAAELIIVIPITSKKKNIPLHIEINPPEGGMKITSYIKCEDIRSVSKERLVEFQGAVSVKTLDKVEQILKLLLL